MKKRLNLIEVLMITITNTLLLILVSNIKSLVIGVLLFIILSFLLTGGISFVTNGKIYGLVEEMKNSFIKFNEGNFTTRIKIKTKRQELLSIVEEFEKLKIMMNTWINELLNSSVSIKLSAGKISDSSDHTSKGMKNLNQSLYEIKQFFEDTTLMLNDVAAATTQLAQSSDSIAKNSAAAVDTARQANSAATEGGNSMTQVSLSMSQIKSNVLDTSHTIEHLEVITLKIEGITDTITAIAKQTTMLALNAAIESARAGEQGKGFAVVAEEVRKLSDETANAVNQINELISNIKSEVSNAVEAMHQVSEEVDKGVEVTDYAKDNLNNIIIMIENTVGLMDRISKDVIHQSQATGMISTNTSTVADKGKTGTESVQKIAEVVDTQLLDVQQNDTSAKELLHISDSLETIMNRFDLTIGKQMLDTCSYIAKLHAKKELTFEDLLKVCEETGLTEVHLVDENGIIIESCNKDVMGFQFNSDEETQTGEFMRILKDSTIQVNQKAAFREVDGKLFKYAGIAMLHKKGIIQCGLDASKMSEFVGAA